MGVQSLWSLLEVCGERVNVESLSGKVVAVDASIWLQQFMKAMRDEKTGDMMKNAHLLGFYRRICRLIFHGIKPVFVFDGAAPAIKQRTMNARRRRREGMDIRLKKTAEKLLLNYVKTVQVERMASRDERVQLGMGGKTSGSDAGIAGSAGAAQNVKSTPPATAVTEEERERLRKGKGKLVAEDDDRRAADGRGMAAEVGSTGGDRSAMASTASDALLAAQISSLGNDGANIDASTLAAISAALVDGAGNGIKGASPDARGAEPAGMRLDSHADGEDASDDDDDGNTELHLTPSELANLDPEAMSMLPTSLQLELMDKLREQNQAENREIFTTLDHHNDFSRVQMEKFLKMSQFRKKVDDIQQGRNHLYDSGNTIMAGDAPGDVAMMTGGDGLVAKRIAADPKREFVFATRLKEEEMPSEGIGARIFEDVVDTRPRVGTGMAGGDASCASVGNELNALVPEAADAEGDDEDCIEIDVNVSSSSDDELEGCHIEWEDANGGEPAPPESEVGATATHGNGWGGASDWRERMRMRQQYFSQSHGFKFGRKLSDWDADEGGPSPRGRARRYPRASGQKDSCNRQKETTGKAMKEGHVPRESRPLSSFINDGGGMDTGDQMNATPPLETSGRVESLRAKRVRFATDEISVGHAAESEKHTSTVHPEDPLIRSDWPGTHAKGSVDDDPGSDDGDIQWEDGDEDARRNDAGRLNEAINEREETAAAEERRLDSIPSESRETASLASHHGGDGSFDTDEATRGPEEATKGADEATIGANEATIGADEATIGADEPDAKNGSSNPHNCVSHKQECMAAPIGETVRTEADDGVGHAHVNHAPSREEAKKEGGKSEGLPAGCGGVAEVDTKEYKVDAPVLDTERVKVHAHEGTAKDELAAFGTKEKALQQAPHEVEPANRVDGPGGQRPLEKVEVVVTEAVAPCRHVERQSAETEAGSSARSAAAAAVTTAEAERVGSEPAALRAQTSPHPVRHVTSTQYFPAGQYRGSLADADVDAFGLRRAPPKKNDARASDSVLRENLEGERKSLTMESRRLRAFADTPTETMYAEVQDLLALFGIPFYISPNEAEAQCASMEMEGLVDGVVTDDNDVFLFGARRVMRNMFDEKKFVEVYDMENVEEKLGLNRERLILIAMMLGSDYTEGIKGVGVVNAMEILGAYGGTMDGLRKFKAFIDSPDEELLRALERHRAGAKAGDEAKDGNDASDQPGVAAKLFEGKHQNMRKNWQLPESFPSEVVRDAYLNPRVDRFGDDDDGAEDESGAVENGPSSAQSAASIAARRKKKKSLLAWGEPDIESLKLLCTSKLGWDEEATAASTEMIKERHFANRLQRQATIDQFLRFRSKFAKIRSRRIQQAVVAITGVKNDEIVLAPSCLGPSQPAAAGRERKEATTKRKRKAANAQN